jgi:hypothetical protein
MADIWDNVGQDIVSILAITFIFGGTAIVGIVTAVVANWRKTRESEHQAVLKQNMLERGMSAVDIERVLRAGPAAAAEEEADRALKVKAAAAASQDERSWDVEVANQLLQHDVPGSEAEQILTAFRAGDAPTRKALAGKIEEMLDSGANGERVLAVVRALCRPGGAAPQNDSGPSPYAGGFRQA